MKKSDPAYPTRFSRLSDPPSCLYVAGELPDLPMVGIVGSRRADPRLARLAELMAGGLAARGFGVVSGGAAGIDAAAHRGTIEAGGKTVAVIGSGFKFLYPAENRRLFEDISCNGAVVSEFEPDVPPAKWTFPKRNRLVAAYCTALVVVQASSRSGAMITARLARSFGVPVGAIPGPPGEERTRGCNLLIQGGATLVENVEDVVKLACGEKFRAQLNLHGLANKVKESSKLAPGKVSGDELVVWERLGAKPVHADDVAALTGLSSPRVAAALLNLELSEFIVDSGGKYFVRTQ